MDVKNGTNYKLDSNHMILYMHQGVHSFCVLGADECVRRFESGSNSVPGL